MTGTTTHLNGFVVQIGLEGTDEVLEATRRHPLYSLDRGDWVAAGRLKTGERLLTPTGPVHALWLHRKRGNHRVYNLEVEDAHSFLVGDIEVWAHNNCGSLFNRTFSRLKSIWSSTRRRSAVQNAFEHYAKHKQDFPDIKNAKEYVDRARAFMNSPPPNTLTRLRPDGSKVFYHKPSNTFAVQNANGTPRTMFKPNPAEHGYSSNLAYYNAQ